MLVILNIILNSTLFSNLDSLMIKVLFYAAGPDPVL